MEHLPAEAERYVREIVQGLPVWQRAELSEELRGHLAQAIAQRVSEGMPEDEAVPAALRAFGPVTEIRREMARAHRSGPNLWWLVDALHALVGGIRLDVLAPVKMLRGRPAGNFARDYQLGRFDAIIERGERELKRSGPRFNLHHELGMAYNAIHDQERALEHLRAEVDWQLAHPRAFGFTGKMALSTAYSNLAGAQEGAGLLAEAERTIRQGLRVDGTHMMLNLQMARFAARSGDDAGALGYLEMASRDQRVRPPGRVLLLLGQDPVFAAIRDEPRFRRIMLRAAAS